MDSPGVDQSPHFQGLRIDLLRRAIEIYLQIAYGDAEPPTSVRRRLVWEPGIDPSTLLSGPPFERVGKIPSEQPIYALRLGNARYPHMKLQIQAWDCPDGFLLSVNTHDHVLAIDPSAPDAEAFMALQAENQRLKVQIEQSWDESGLPTFPRYLRNYLSQQTEGTTPILPPGD
ncbi:hypothetical protein P12x_001730 [Tundrisphaera lichenicola]|uniref:hypothetical protein n=1 Tax=Tundrisphaera lichenicola TaxID=2029860 RepID=UPI003EB7E19B